MFKTLLWIILFIAIIVFAVRLFAKSKSSVWYANIEQETLQNNDWRRVLATTDGLQVVVMNTPVGESLGWEVHNSNDQFFRVESGTAVLSTARMCKDGYPTEPVDKVILSDGMSAMVPRGTCHNLQNTGKEPLRMYTIYGPKHHPDGTIDHTHADELAREN